MRTSIDYSVMDRILHNRRHIVVSGHRGAKALFPENTLYSFQRAFDMGVDSIEIDLNITADGEVVIIHDTTVDRTTNGRGPVRMYKLAELKELDASCSFNEAGQKYTGEPLEIPTLIELCELLKQYPEMMMNVEIKDYAHETVDKAVEILTQYRRIEKCVFTCFNADVISYMFDEYGLKIQGFYESMLKNFVPGEQGTYSKMYAVGIPIKLLTSELCADFENKGILAWSYCPDCDADVMRSLECGVRLVTANNPEPALRIFKELGYR